jgi:copper resistance protein B
MRLRCAAAATTAAIAVLSLMNCTRAGAVAPEADEAAPYGSPVADEDAWMHAILDQFEGRISRANGLRWEGEAWTGTDTDRLWLKSEGELQNGKLSDGQNEVFYDTPISTYFDLQAGLRYDLDSRAGRGWAALGIEGLSEYFFHVSATGYASDTGHFAAKLFASYDLLITQRLILQPEMEINLYSKSDPRRLVGAGFSDLDTGLRLRYEISRKFAPYVGLTQERKFGRTATLAVLAGEQKDALRFTIGVRSWF